MGKLKRTHLMKTSHENLVRFATWLGLKRLDGMSQRQLSKLVMWLVTRREKRSRGMIVGL